MTSIVAVGIDLGGTNLRTGVVDREGRILGRQILPTDKAAEPESVIGQMAELADRSLAGTGVSRSQLAAVGVGCPGPLSASQGRIIHCANLPNWRDVPLRDLLMEKLGVAVLVENDANSAAFGEYWVGAGRDGKDMVMFTLGTGLGSGVIVDGHLLHGHFENAAEMGHTIVDVNGLLCPCGQRGCLEQYVSASSVARRAVAAMRSGATSALNSVAHSGQGVDAAAVAACVREKDPLCLRVWNETCVYLAVACINVQHTLNPARVVLGGGLARAGGLLLDGVESEFQRRQWTLHKDRPEIVLARLGDDAGMIGAAGLAWRMTEGAVP